MSAPASKAAIEQLQKAIDANEKAGDWVYGATTPFSPIPIPIDGPLTPQAITSLTAPLKAPPKK